MDSVKIAQIYKPVVVLQLKQHVQIVLDKKAIVDIKIKLVM